MLEQSLGLRQIQPSARPGAILTIVDVHVDPNLTLSQTKLEPYEMVSVKVSISPMTQLILSRRSMLRAAIVVAALFSLYVASNVGPHFLPLPTPENYAAENLLQHSIFFRRLSFEGIFQTSDD
jgi:hypothetical protein